MKKTDTEKSMASQASGVTQQVLASLKEQAANFMRQIAELEGSSNQVPGSDDGLDDLPVPTPPPPKLTVREKVEAALSKESLEPAKLIKIVGEDEEKVREAVKQLRIERKVFNVGMGDLPIWTWVVGDAADTPTLMRVIRRLISERPMTTRELTAATGARYSRVEGAIVELRRDESLNMRDLGIGHAGRWLIIEQSRDAKLDKKKPAKMLQPRRKI